jgi:uncharacterized protein with NRDE domain
MCLVLFAWQAHPRYRLVVAANRDEFRARPTAAADWWGEEPIWGGRDLLAGGTWLGVDRAGRVAAVTNVREAAEREAPKHPRSRGALTADFLRSSASPAAHIDERLPVATEFGPHNLLVGDAAELRWWSNRADAPRLVEPGVHGLSNAALDTPWPKVVSGVAALQAALADEPDVDALFSLLDDRSIAPDEQLPDTGFGLEWERRLSPRFLEGPVYGTRASTVLLIGDEVVGYERRFDEAGAEVGRSSVRFAV